MANRPDDALILYFYGEHEAPEKIERLLAADPELARRYELLRRELGALDALAPPEPRPGLESRMWARVAPELARPSRRFALPSGWLRWTGLATALVVVALGGFLVGRSFRTAPDVGLSPAARERVLQAALVNHLESSQLLLTEIANGARCLDERARVADLMSENRLYRGAAERAGDRRIAALLAELEALLAELADSPADARTASEEMLFKVRIARNNLKRLS